MENNQIADAVSPRVELTIAGQKYRLLLSHSNLIEAEEIIGMNILYGDSASIFRPSAKILRALLYVALKRAGAEFTLMETGEFITPANILQVQEAIQGAWFASMPAPEPAADPQQTATSSQ